MARTPQLLFTAILAIQVACGGGDGTSNEPQDDVITPPDPPAQKEILAIVNHLGMFYGMSYETQRGEIDKGFVTDSLFCWEGNDITFAISATVLGTAVCKSHIQLSEIVFESTPLDGDRLFNAAWLARILDIDQEYGEIHILENGVFAASIDLDVSPTEFIDVNDLRSHTRGILESYMVTSAAEQYDFDGIILDWTDYTADEKLDLILGDLVQAEQIFASYSNLHDLQVSSVEDFLEDGFPFRGGHHSGVHGTFKDGPHNAVTIANVHGGLNLEILVSAYNRGPLHVLNSLGDIVATTVPTGNPDLSIVADTSEHIEKGVVVTSGHHHIAAYDEMLTFLPGWPIVPDIHANISPSAIDIDGDGTDELIISEFAKYYSVYKLNGERLLTLECREEDTCAQTFGVPAVGDFDRDGKPEILGFNNHLSQSYLFESNGEVATNFPIKNTASYPDNPLVGDLDHDGEYEFIAIYDFPSGPIMDIYNFKGIKEYSVQFSRTVIDERRKVVLADLNADGFPEIVSSSQSYVEVFEFVEDHFRYKEGWPQRKHLLSGFDFSKVTPVVADVDGDQQPDIITTWTNNSEDIRFPGIKALLVAYNSNGQLLTGFPMDISELNSDTSHFLLSPAVGDIDLDQRNEIIIAGSSSTESPVVYVLDLGGGSHGSVEWGEFGKDKKNSNFYESPIVN